MKKLKFDKYGRLLIIENQKIKMFLDIMDLQKPHPC